MRDPICLLALAIAILPGRSSADVAAYQFTVTDMGEAFCPNITDGSGLFPLAPEGGLYLVGSRVIVGVQTPSYNDGAAWHDLPGGPQGGLLKAGSVDGEFFVGYTNQGFDAWKYHAAVWRRSDGAAFDVEAPAACGGALQVNCWKSSQLLTISNTATWSDDLNEFVTWAGGWGTWIDNNGVYRVTAVYIPIGPYGPIGSLQDAGSRIIDTLTGLPGNYTQITSINKDGIAVGTYTDQTGTNIGFLLDLTGNGNSQDWGRAAGWSQEILNKITDEFFVGGSALNNNISMLPVLFIPNPSDVTPDDGSTSGEITSMALSDYAPSTVMPPSIGYTDTHDVVIWNPWNEAADLSTAPYADFSGWDAQKSVWGIRKDGVIVGTGKKAGVGHCFMMTPTTFPKGFVIQPWGQGWTSQQQVLLNAPVPGQNSSLTIRLESSNDFLASVPGEVVINSGESSATFTVTRHWPDPGGVLINAYLGGVVTTSSPVTWP